MPQTRDRRSEGKVLDSEGVKQRRQREARRAAGLCTHCGKTEVAKRSWCEECVNKQIIANMRSAVRRYTFEAIQVLNELGFTVVKN